MITLLETRVFRPVLQRTVSRVETSPLFTHDSQKIVVTMCGWDTAAKRGKGNQVLVESKLS